MDTIMVTSGRGFTGRHITARLTAGGRSVVSYNRDFDSSEDGVVMVQGELFDVSRLVRVLQQHGIREIVHMFPSGRIQIGPGRVGELDMQGPSDGEAARRDLGYEPEWTLERGLADYAEWLKTHEA